MIIKYIYITENALNMANRLCNEEIKLDIDGNKEISSTVISFSEFKNNKKDIFDNSDFLVFIMATGIVVRVIAQLIESKFTDPGIIVMDELGKNVISLLSGHIGGANELTELIAQKIGANPVITTATDVNEKGSFDLIVKKMNAQVDKLREKCLEINSMILKEERINIFIQKEYRESLSGMLSGFYVIESIDEITDRIQSVELGNNKERFIIITDRIDYLRKAINSDKKNVENKFIEVVPRKNVLGVGCRKFTNSVLFENEVLKYLEENNILLRSICEIASIDVKKSEKCILDFADKYRIKSKFFNAEELSKIDYKYEKSDFVKKTVGVFSVSEPSCDLLCDGNLIGNKFKSKGITISIGRKK